MTTRATTYQRQHLKESLLPWPPEAGSRARVDAKFHAARDGAIPGDAAAVTATEFEASAHSLSPRNFVRPVRQLGLLVLPMDKPTAATSEYTAVFTGAATAPKRLRRVTPAALEQAFAALDVRGEGFVLLAELPQLLADAYARSGIEGQGPEGYVVTTLSNVYTRDAHCLHAADGRCLVSLEHLLEGVDAVAGMLEEDIATGRPEVLCKSGSLRNKDATSRLLRGVSSPSREAVLSLGSPRSVLSASGTAKSPCGIGGSGFLGEEPRAVESNTVGTSLDEAAGSQLRTTVLVPPASPSRNERTASLGASLAVGTRGLLTLVASPGTSARLLTAGPLGYDPAAAAAPVTGLHMQSIREAALSGERALAAGGSAAARALRGDALPPPFELSGPEQRTSNVRDLGDYGFNPRTLPVAVAGIAGAFTTVNELAVGTTRVSQHPPGFTGHVASSHYGAAHEFGRGAVQRDSYNASTNKCDTFFPRVPGYTGFMPRSIAIASPVVDKPHGVTALAEYDAAY